MTVPIGIERNDYPCTGAQVVFPFTFEIFADSELYVVLSDDVTGLITELVLTTDYTVAGANVSNGGNVTTVATYPAGKTLSILSRIPYSQQTQLKNQGRYFAATVERAFDRIVRMVKQLIEIGNRSIQTPASELRITPLTIPTVVIRRLTYLGFDTNGDPIAVAGTGSSIVSAAMAPVVAAISLAAARTAFSVNSIAQDTAALALKLSLTGGAMSGAIVLAGDPTLALHPATKQYVDARIFSGLIVPSLSAAAPAGWLNLQGGTVGNGASGGSVRANADTAGLFTYLWTNLSDTKAPVSGGRGGSAAADFAANKTITLPDLRNRALVGAGQATVVELFDQAAVNIGTDTVTIASNDRRWNNCAQFVFNIITGSLTGAGIADGATLWWIRTGPTTGKFATTLANAQNGTAIDITAVGGASTFKMTATFTARVIGEDGGEEYHAISSTELTAHSHLQAPNTVLSAGGGVACVAGGAVTVGGTTQATGGNAAINVMDPFYATNWIISL